MKNKLEMIETRWGKINRKMLIFLINRLVYDIKKFERIKKLAKNGRA